MATWIRPHRAPFRPSSRAGRGPQLVPVKRHRGSRDTHGTHGTRGRAQRHTDHTDEPHCTGKTPVTITGTCSATRDELPVDPYGYKDVGRAPSSHLTLFPNSHLIRRLCGGAENYRNLSDRILTQYRLPPPSVFYRQRAVASAVAVPVYYVWPRFKDTGVRGASRRFEARARRASFHNTQCTTQKSAYKSHAPPDHLRSPTLHDCTMLDAETSHILPLVGIEVHVHTACIKRALMPQTPTLTRLDARQQSRGTDGHGCSGSEVESGR